MRTDLHLQFPGTCKEAFALYETVFGSKIQMMMTYGEAPAGTPVPANAHDLVMHATLPLGDLLLMGCDAPPDRPEVMGGFQISISVADPEAVTRMFEGLSAGGTVRMPLQATFWTSLFGMCTDKYGVAWMLSVPGPEPA